MRNAAEGGEGGGGVCKEGEMVVLVVFDGLGRLVRHFGGGGRNFWGFVELERVRWKLLNSVNRV